MSLHVLNDKDHSALGQSYNQDKTFYNTVQHLHIPMTWELKENCFLYKDKFQINTLPEDILEINTLEVPVLISDEYFGEVEVFYEKITKSFALNPLIKKITVKYQGCNAKGFSYPLIAKQLILKDGEIFINKGT